MLLKDLCTHNVGTYGIGASACSFNKNYPTYLRITDITDDGKLVKPLPTSIDPNSYPNWKEYILSKNDLVFARTGNSTGRNYFHNSEEELVYAGFLIRFSLNPEKIVPRYVGYYCQSKSYWKQISSLLEGSTRPTMSAELYRKLDIPIVSKAIQQHIVDTIGTIDDLIEISNRIFSFLINLALIKYLSFKAPKVPATNIVQSTFSYDWGKDKEELDVVPCLMIRVTDINKINNGDLPMPPMRYVASQKLKLLQPFDIAIEISGGSPTQSTGRCCFITKALLNTFQLPISTSGFSRTIRCNDNASAVSLYFELQKEYRIKGFFDYQNGTSGLRNLNLRLLLNELNVKKLSSDQSELLEDLVNRAYQKVNENTMLKEEKGILLKKYF